MITKPLTTGPFDTREELVAEIVRRWENPRARVAAVAMALGVSWPTVKRILVAEGIYKNRHGSKT